MELSKERLLELSPAGSWPNQEGSKGEASIGRAGAEAVGREKVSPSADLLDGLQAWGAAYPLGSSQAGAMVEVFEREAGMSDALGRQGRTRTG